MCIATTVIGIGKAYNKTNWSLMYDSILKARQGKGNERQGNTSDKDIALYRVRIALEAGIIKPAKAKELVDKIRRNYE